MTDNVYIGVILDRSGSMSSVKDDAVGGFNEFLKEQQGQHSGTLRLTLFNTNAETIYAGPLEDCPELTNRTYVPAGMTALYDAVGLTVSEIGRELGAMQPADRPVKVVVAILTDGLENSSTEHTKQAVKMMIEHQEEKYNWAFIFLGANMDASAEAQAIGIRADYASSFVADSAGTQEAYRRMGASVRSILGEDSGY